jgi:DNA-binding NarL/FixJ family response regulator
MFRNTPIRLTIIGGQILFRDALASSLSLQPDFRVMGCYSSLEDAAPMNRITPVSIVLLSFDPSQETGAAVMARARNAGFRCNILVVTAGLRDREVLGLMEKGCAGIFLKSQPLSMLHQRIRSMASDRPGPTAVLATMQRVETRVLPILTPRETMVLRALLAGGSNREIAASLGISENTVKTFLQQLYRKTGTRTRSKLICMASEQYRYLGESYKSKEFPSPQRGTVRALAAV